MQIFVWRSYTPTMTIALPDTQALARQSVPSNANFTGPILCDSSLTMCNPAQPAAEASRSTTSLWAHISLNFLLIAI